MDELLRERYALAGERILEMEDEEVSNAAFSAYFKRCATWFAQLFDTYVRIEDGSFYELPIERLQEINRMHYEEILGKNYETSYANPAYAVRVLGDELGALGCALYGEFRNALGYVYGQYKEEFVAVAELFLETAGAFACAWEDGEKLPGYEEVRSIFYWYVSDYAEVRSQRQVEEKVKPLENRVRKIVCEHDLTDLCYLYFYGKYVSDCELRTARFLNDLPKERIAVMADTFTEGYRIGFQITGKDLSIKKSGGIHYHLGFERVVRRAVENFKKMGLAALLYPDCAESTRPNRQCDYDHKDDSVYYFDRPYKTRKLETVKTAFERHREAAAGYAGPAVIEVFGEEPFAPEPKREVRKPDEKHQKLLVEYRSAYQKLQGEYIKEEERSFTIIAFPVPAIGDRFEEIFDEIIRINTLDYKLYQGIQQTIIDALDTADHVKIKGMNGNRTDLEVALFALRDPEKETCFENCVADVNIPVGEVFTSPRLAGTNGVLHVSRVFLNELEYRDLELTFRDGMVSGYRCGNFEDEEEGRRYVRENVLFCHDTLPLGEFAIGTNTTAYVAAEKYDIGAKLPILIAEKMGPHFAVGDTCYSHEEELVTYNPDGKAIVARENELVAAGRKEAPEKAYFNCHTDITIPYHELGELSAVAKDGTRIVIIKDGRFVLPGCEELNRPFDEK